MACTGLAGTPADFRGTVQTGKGADMSDKSPRKSVSKKPGKTLKEKRQAKKDKAEKGHGLIP